MNCEGLECANSRLYSPVGFLYTEQPSLSGVCLKQATTLACCPSSASAAVGTENGYVYFLNVSDVESPQVISSVYLSQSPVKILM